MAHRARSGLFVAFVSALTCVAALQACSSSSSAPSPDGPPGALDGPDGGSPEDATKPSADGGDDASRPGNGTSIYKTNNLPIVYDFSTTLPAKGQSRVEPTTGATVVRLTDRSVDLPSSEQLFNEYSRYSAENVTGEYVLLAGDNSTSSVVLERSSHKVIASLTYDDDPSHGIGAYHEIRWHPNAAHPYRVYYVNETALYMIDDVRRATTRTLVRDFAKTITWGASAPGLRRVYNAQEGNLSHDGDHFAFMASYYDGATWVVRAFVHYQVSTDIQHTLYPSDLAGTARVPAGESTRETFRYAPNMVEMAPDASGVVIHHARAYPPGSNDPGLHIEYVGSIFEAPSFWPIDLKSSTFQPFRLGPDATHSGWAVVGGAWYFVEQDNRRDKYTAVPVSGPHRGYGAEGQLDVNVGLNTAGIIDFFDDGPYYAGAHFGVTNASADGWCMVSTYTSDSSTKQYRANGLYMQQIKPVSQKPVIWHVAPAFNIWPPDDKQDWNEGQAAMNLQGNRIHVAGDWEKALDHVDVFEVELPASWQAHFAQ